MSTTLSSLTNFPQAAPWYRVIPPVSWLTRPRQPKRLRPAGHSAWVEAMHQPILFLISLAFTSAGLYTLARDYVLKAFTAIGAGTYGQIIPVSLALFVIVITGAAIEIAFLTAASRLRMHLLRKEWGWTLVSAIMLLLTVGTEGLTCSYMFYLIEAPQLSPEWLAFMQNIPTLLFFVRAFAGLVCAAYLIIGVLPFVIRPDDVRREMAAEAGAAKVAIIQRLLHVINDLSVWQMLAIYEPVAAIFRDNAGYTSSQMTHRLVLTTLGTVREQLVAAITEAGTDADHLMPTLATVFDPIEREFQERGTGAELERYDQQTHDALTRLQERLLSAQQQMPQETGIATEQWEHLTIAIATLREQVATIAATDTPDLESRFTEWSQQVDTRIDQIQDLVEQVQERLSGEEEGDDVPIQTMRMEIAPKPQTPKPQPKPGTKRFNALVVETAIRLLSEHRMTIFNIAQMLQIDPQRIQDAITTLKEERILRLKPGKELVPDPVLDVL